MNYPSEFPKYAIGIPTLNRWDLLRPALYLYLQEHPHIPIYVLDNGHQARDVVHKNITYIVQQNNIGVSASWNVLCNKIFDTGFPFALIANDDIILGKTQYEIGNLLHFQKGNLFRSIEDWSVFIMPQQTFAACGPFDEKFKGYYGDNDYEWRLKQCGLGYTRCMVLQPKIHRRNSTSDRMPEVLVWARQELKYYMDKWGDIPGRERFKTAFNK